MKTVDGAIVDQVKGKEKGYEHDGEYDGCHFRPGNTNDEDTIRWVAFDRADGSARQPPTENKINC